MSVAEAVVRGPLSGPSSTARAADEPPTFVAEVEGETVGFLPLESLPQVWGPENPRLLMARVL
ncbi:MAG TPA: hypothetical protein VIL79_06830 [Thermoleophilia bacterium]